MGIGMMTRFAWFQVPIWGQNGPSISEPAGLEHSNLYPHVSKPAIIRSRIKVVDGGKS